MTPRRRRWLFGVVLLGLVGASCGDDDPAGDDSVPVDTTAATDPPAAETTTDPSTTSAPTTAAPTTAPATTNATITTTTAATPTSTTPPASTAPATSAPTTVESTAPPGSTALADRPIVAIEAAGDAVYFASPDASPVLLYDGPEPGAGELEEGPGPNVVDVIAITPDGSNAWVGLCCEPVAGAVLGTETPAPATYETSERTFGYGPAVDPTGSYLAIGHIFDSPIVVTRLTDRAVLTGPPLADEVQFSPYDTIWSGDTIVAALGILSDPDPSWVIIVRSVEGDELVDVDTIVVAPLDEASYYFAGSLDGGRVAVHAIGSDTALAVPITGPGEIDTLDLPGPSQSYWFGGVEADVRVDADGVLTVGDQVLPGEFTWARG